MSDAPLKAPFPYFGGKSKVAAEVWRRLGKVDNYVEPFFGSGAVLLGCPWPGHTETVNDADGLLCNFWRALQADPDAVARYADYPVSELDLHARHRWLVRRRIDIEAALSDPDYYDAKAAGWWVWGISQWIGSGWCPPDGARGRTKDGGTDAKRPHLATKGKALNRKSFGQLPKIGANGTGSDSGKTGVFRDDVQPPRSYGKLPAISAQDGGGERTQGIFRERSAILDYLRALAARLRRVRVTCGDFERVLGPSVTWRHGVSAIFLDPPYHMSDRAEVYAIEQDDVAHRAWKWACENGNNKLLRIALCGYEGHYEMPDGWSVLQWKTPGGYGSQGQGRGRDNARREVAWFSPHCVPQAQLRLWPEL